LFFFDKHNPESIGKKSALTDFPQYFSTVIIHGHFMNAKIPFDFHKQHETITDYLVEAMKAMNKHKNS
jgi:hypothetical protein